MNDESLNEALSAVMDGRATPAQWARVNAAWANDPALRERWALWHVAGDGLRSADLPGAHVQPQPLLDALHARMPAAVLEHRRRRDWFAPVAVAASFVALAFGLGVPQPPAAPEPLMAAAPFAAPRPQGFGGLSFAQAAAGRTLPPAGDVREPGLPVHAVTEIVDWGALPESAASRPGP